MIELEKVSVKYGQALALEEISVRIDFHEIVAIVGRNGAGKTTLLKTLVGLMPLVAGRRLLGDQDISGLGVEAIAKLGVALVPDTRRIFPNLTVLENLKIGALAHQPGHWTLDRVLDVFQRLRERLNFGGDQLSGGEQQMLSIGRALLGNPRILLLDEPTEGLAPVIVDQLVRVFSEVHRQGTGIVLVEQNLKVPMKLAHRQYVLDHGQVAWSGTAQELDAQRVHVEGLLTTGAAA
ncbi:ABC transporter ATP-binding protein [Pulveribacter sp.]|uniref:ABC transporter ATP-binding protein n=1 Tax=Pulveribacter sp. TaxID=2678893 RepID=UPI0028AA13C5|nr:ABC transporter ATP-binding protein [Pulveribacter sp.]